MTLKQHFELLAQYNQWLNEKIYTLCNELPSEKLGTLGADPTCTVLWFIKTGIQLDQVWLRRFAQHPAGFVSLMDLRYAASEPLSETLPDDLEQLWSIRYRLDRRILDLCDELEVCHLSYPLAYQNRQHYRFEKRFGYLLQHLFNQQTHARGGLVAALQMQGIVLDTTELLAVIPEA
ncbi:DinB family protein [Neptuniibacter sp. CAU 1671]|uniref:DinB family protein n=1 Tax=Neptuniibacter sp. CAU 1671 TaxID=3032593 RepID=UPI0023DBCDD1|nr:DinB family protein [Neptuniibacter sp. CAU 1671]MDF2182876.1 DinB family protein [Neptuniibacter sp. CAU 1671]